MRRPARGIHCVLDQLEEASLRLRVRVIICYQGVTADLQSVVLIEREDAGPFTLWVTSPGWRILEPSPDDQGSRINLDAGRHDVQDVTIVLARPGTVHVTVRWSEGDSVTEYELVDHHRWVADPHGASMLDGSPPGRRPLRVRSSMGVMGSTEIDLEPGGEMAAEIVLPAAECALGGKVIDAAGVRFHGVKVSVTGPAFEASVLPDEDGRFAFTVPAGSYHIAAHSLADRFGKVIATADVSVGSHPGEERSGIPGRCPQEVEVTLRVPAAPGRASW